MTYMLDQIRCYLPMSLRILEICVLIHIYIYFVSLPSLAWQACLKKTKVKLEQLTDYDMVLMFEAGIRGGICQSINKYTTANNRYMKNYNKKAKSSYLQNLDANKLYRWAMCKKLPIDGFKWSKNLKIYTEDFIKRYDDDDDSDRGYLLEVDHEYPKTLHKTHKDLAFLPERRKINEIEKLITALNDKEKYIVHISALKQALNHGLKFKKVHRVIEFRQTDWMKSYIDMNTKLRTEAKNEFEKDFFKLMNNAVFGKTMENVRKHRDIKLVVTSARRKKLVSEPNYHACKQFSENLIAIEMRRTHIMMDKPLYLGQAILGISKTLMYEFYHDYLKVKYNEKVKLCCTDTDSFIMNVETEDFYKDIANDVDKWFDTSNYGKNDKRPLLLGKNKKVIGKFKDELNGKIMSEFIALSAKVYAFTIDGFNDDDYDKNGFINKKAKGTKKCVIKKTIIIDDYEKALFNNEKIRRNQQRFKSDHHAVNTTNNNKTA